MQTTSGLQGIIYSFNCQTPDHGRQSPCGRKGFRREERGQKARWEKEKETVLTVAFMCLAEVPQGIL